MRAEGHIISQLLDDILILGVIKTWMNDKRLTSLDLG